ncbi:MAG: restriction endonuclease subunit S [Bacteroidota bacterium]|uniref:restriction endonuclease subunit S n=1 Tax=Macellibacteroides fermentans TaxID=879969 RepID=UPI00288FFB35|nr:restriction endonuclease subunit S [Bacteroidota bacterium]HML71897.1 restriction endonuclease subunit S [Macellibacteroides fermentans]
MEKKKNTPKLRFPEFTGEWEEKKICDVSSYVDYRGKTPSKSDSGVFLVTAKNIKQGYIDYDISKEYIPNEIYEDAMRRGKPKLGDVLITTEAPLGNVASIDKENIALAQRVIKLRGKNGLMQNLFLKHRLISPQFQNEIDKKGTGTTAKGIKGSELHQIVISFPICSEQTKIATFLTAVDEKLTQLKKKKTLLEQYKKGVMQKLFSQELRFKDDNNQDFPDWQEKTLGELTYKVDKKNKENIQYPIYSINNINGFIPQSDQFDGMDSNKRGYDISLYKIIERNTFAYNPARINVGSLGYSGNLHDIIISSLYVCFKTVEDVYDNYLLQYFTTKQFIKAVLTNVEGGVREYLFYENFSRIDLSLPSLPEQVKIANFLSAIDEKISHCSAQIEKMEAWKKGLLQQMFC